MDAAAWDTRYAASGLIWTAEPNRWVTEVLAGRPPGTAVDLACGEGRNAIWLAERGWAVTGVDFSAAALDKASVLAHQRGVRVDWQLADLADWRTRQPVDLVLLAYLQVSEQLRRPVHRAAAQALETGGTLLVIGHDSTNLTHGVGGPQDPAVLFAPDDVLADVDGLGLTVARAERVHRPVEGRPHPAIDVLVELRRPA
ncbi:Methyltransferase domain-containing protein [Modestobacter sp. DSM 44400]|uniref:class I SAM-dependent methyltransferase n=1 Tax=Modestobacter sp. DSM 44400 TaxID=1550230 RepID=UPI0008951ACA|nr:class I SAM-dependent methyltransferase [Modestobacter sp. DSM 44400]SDY80103.1 Methyltransferase domain-containing protein [Modestobacter sp. DSM 44400]